MAKTPWLTPEDVSQLLDCTVVQLNNWRHRKTGPAYYKVGGLVKYRPEDVDSWLEAQRVDPEAS